MHQKDGMHTTQRWDVTEHLVRGEAGLCPQMAQWA